MIRIISNLICDKINIQTVWHDNTVRTHVHATFMLKQEIWRFLSSSLIFGFGSSILSFLYGPHWHWHMRNEYTCTRVILQVLAPFLHDHVLSLHPFVHRYTSTSIPVVVLPLPNSYTVARTRRHSESSHCIWHRIRIGFFFPYALISVFWKVIGIYLEAPCTYVYFCFSFTFLYLQTWKKVSFCCSNHVHNILTSHLHTAIIHWHTPDTAFRHYYYSLLHYYYPLPQYHVQCSICERHHTNTMRMDCACV